MLAGQPARTSSEGKSILFHPLWEEHALYSDADISGDVEVGPYKLVSTASSSRGLGRSAQALVLRHADHLYEAPVTPIEEELDVRGWTGGNLGDQMAALLALALGRRVRSGGVVRQGFEPGDPLGRPTALTHRAPPLAEPTREPMLPGIAAPVQMPASVELFEAYSRLSAADAAALTRAAGQYADALWWADADPRISWIKLVGALDTGANRHDQAQDYDDPVALFKRHRGALYGRLKEIDSEAARVAAEGLAGMLNAEAKFLAFTLAYAPGAPEFRPVGGRVDFDELESPLRGVYEWRSRDLHDGIPFPQPLCEPPISGTDGVYERFPLIASQAEGGTWPAEQLPMYLHTFAHLVGGALRNWWGQVGGAGARRASSPRNA